MNDAAETPGTRLRRERERQGLSKQKAADELRLDLAAIDALETDNFARVGPPVYARGHLRKYAQLLGLPREEILAGYESMAVGAAVAPSPQLGGPGFAAPAALANLSWPPVIGGVLVALLCAGVLLWRPWQQRTTAGASVQPAAQPAAQPPSEPPAAANAAAAPADSDQPTADEVVRVAPQTSAESSADAAGAAAMPDRATKPDAPPAGEAHLRISFTADSWVDVRDALGTSLFVGTGKGGSAKSVSGAAPLHVYLGNARGVSLELNDHAVPISPAFQRGDTARFDAAADGALRAYTNPARPRG